ncbi:TonB-dependent receptor plug domain-containing protein [Sphingomonas oryzagri]
MASDTHLFWFAMISGISAISGGAVSAAHAEDNRSPTIPFDIPAGSLQSALIAFGTQAHLQLLYPPDAVAARTVAAVHGQFSPDIALEQLIAGTGLHARWVNPKVVVLDSTAPTRAVRPVKPTASLAEPSGSDFGPSRVPSTAIATQTPQEIIVTGSNIRGGNPVGATVRTITRADMLRNGYATVAQAVQALPGNFAGSATEQSALSLADSTGTNSGLATGVNLRGLGADATLVLINGHRVAGSGLMGNFSDISGIPTGAVDRIEVLMDGASALYGSDAVGGVVNIVLKRRFDGAESDARVGSVTAGGLRQIQLDQSIGRIWSSGSVFVSYEFNRSTSLASADRRFARSADSRPLGGSDHRFYFSLPGNILGFDPATGSYSPAYAIPPGQDGTALSPGDFLPGTVNLENYRANTDLTPDQTLHTLYASATQSLFPGVSLSLDARYSHRRFSVRSPEAMTIMAITDANPWFVSPTGSSSDLVAYAFGREFGPIMVTGKAQAMSFEGELTMDLGPGWQARLFGGYAKEIDLNLQTHMVNDYALSEALGTIADDPATSYDTAIDGYFNPYGNGTSNSAKTLDYVGSGYSRIYGRSQIATGNAQADGPLFRWAGGTAKLAIGINARKEMLAQQITNFDLAASPTVGDFRAASRTILAGFAELRVPIVGADNALPGVQKLELSAAGRFEHYSDFGNSANPSIGLRWTPVRGIAIRGTVGTSFRSPNLRQLHDPSTVSAILLPRGDGSQAVVIQEGGGNPDLRPEKAKTWTVGVDMAPPRLPGLSVGVSAFRTIFSHRIDQPVIGDINRALTSADYAPFVRVVHPAADPSDLALVTSLLARAATGYPATAIGAIVDNRFVNTGRIDVSGIDLDAKYGFPVGSSRVDLAANGTWLTRYRVNLTPTSAPIERSNLAGYPAALRGRLSAGWDRGAWNALIAMNYVGRYHDADGQRISAWTTFDLEVGWQSVAKSGWRKGLSVTLSSQNIFDKDPPFYDSVLGTGYDAANAGALGRVVALQISKRW